MSSISRLLADRQTTVNFLQSSVGLPKEDSRGCFVCDPPPAGRIRAGTARSGPGRPSDRVLHLPVAHGEASAPRAEPHRHLRQDGQVLEASDRGAGEAGGPSAEGAAEARAGGRAHAVVSGSSRVDPPEMQARRGKTSTRGLREAAVRRTGTPGHPEAAGRGQGTGPTRVGERIVAPGGGGAPRPTPR